MFFPIPALVRKPAGLLFCAALFFLFLALTPEVFARAEVAGEAEIFPKTDAFYSAGGSENAASLGEVLKARVVADPFNLAATILFFLAIAHTFAAPRFLKIAHHFQKKHDIDLAEGKIRPNAEGNSSSFPATVFHFLGEVEAIFGIWAVILFLTICAWPELGWATACHYIDSCNYTEPLFVVVIMAIASTRPVVGFASRILGGLAGLGKKTPAAWWFAILTLAPLFGSFITEPAAMTIAALLLARQIFSLKPSPALCYATLGLLFVNVSIGGTLTNFAAPPVLMVASKWGWSIPAMLHHFGWKAFSAIFISNALFFFFFRTEFGRLAAKQRALLPVSSEIDDDRAPAWVTLAHIGFMVWTVVMLLNHHTALFVGGFLFFIAFATATARFQNSIRLREPLLVGFFLAGLVIHGGLQGWWIGPVLKSLSEVPLFFGATILTSFNDNAAITFLASQVSSFSTTDAAGNLLVGEAFASVERLHYAVLAGAVTGGGLTVIANAPNPAGQAILGKYFDGGISPVKLFLYALLPTLIAGACFMLLPGK